MPKFPSFFLERTASIEELMGDNFVTTREGGYTYPNLQSFMERWRVLISNGDTTRFENRLALLNQTEIQVLAKLSGYRRADTKEPPWANRAKELFNLLSSNTPTEITNNFLGDYPFIEILDAALCNYKNELISHLETHNIKPDEAKHISQIAISHLANSWRKSLSPILYSLFDQYRKKNKGASYRLFTRAMIKSGFTELFEARPVLLRVLAIELEQWLENAKEFLFRLGNDLEDISGLLSDKTNLGLLDVTSIDFELSDLHNHGKSVCLITFRDTQKLIYKPKDLRGDVLMANLISLLHKKSESIDLRLPRTLAREGYGWTEYVLRLDCQTLEQVQSHYFSSGAWLGIFYALNGSDIHEENIIASGANPIPVDLEVLFQGSDSGTEAANAFKKARQIISNTVLGVGMLPSYGKDHLNNYYELGGLKERVYEENIFSWTSINTDEMDLKIQKHQYKNDKNVPTLNTVKQEITKYRDDFIEGFIECIKLISSISNTTEFKSLIRHFGDIEFRKVYRPTFFYGLVINRLKDFKTLNNGLEWSLHAEFFYRLIDDWEKSGIRDQIAIARQENQASISLNIPYFTINGQSKFAYSLEGAPFQSDASDGFETVSQKISQITDKEIAWQSQLIDLSLNFQDHKKLNISEKTKLSNPLEIAEFIASKAIRENDTAAWIGLEWHEEIDKFQLSILGQDFYNGNGGIALFLAASSLAYRQDDLLKLAYAAISPLRQKLNNDPASVIRVTSNIGIGVGLASHIYTLNTLGLLLDDKELINDASIAATLLNDDLINSDKVYDIMGGSAGAIVALLKLHQTNSQLEPLNKAVHLGNYLINNIDQWINSATSPTSQSTNEVNGFAHGAAGIALALFNLAKCSKNLKFFEAAKSIVAIENSTFSSEAYNWPDVRFKHLPENQWACQWCHGASGIGLARIASSRFIDPSETKAQIIQDIENAVNGVLKRELPGPLDSLCCGNLGNIDFLKEAGLLLKRNDLLSLADQHLSKIIDRYKVDGDYCWNSGTSALNFGLFRGLSGLGYEMLRSNKELKLPNVLMWE